MALLLWYRLYFDVNLVLSCPCLAAKRSSAFNNIELIFLAGAIKLALRRGWTLRSVPFDASHSSETAIDGIKNCWGASSCSQCKDLHNVCAQFNIGIEPRLEKNKFFWLNKPGLYEYVFLKGVFWKKKKKLKSVKK